MTEVEAMRVHGLSAEQLLALMRLTRDNQGFDDFSGHPCLKVIDGGRRGGASQRPSLAPRLSVVET